MKDRDRVKWRATIKKWESEHPWYVSYRSAQQRCNNPKNCAAKNYYYKGIKLLMNLKDFEFLWFRDKAHDMKKPSIDRMDSNGHYELSNCRFVELADNTRNRPHLKGKEWENSPNGRSRINGRFSGPILKGR